jgi:hypothetical protein
LEREDIFAMNCRLALQVLLVGALAGLIGIYALHITKSPPTRVKHHIRWGTRYGDAGQQEPKSTTNFTAFYIPLNINNILISMVTFTLNTYK